MGPTAPRHEVGVMRGSVAMALHDCLSAHALNSDVISVSACRLHTLAGARFDEHTSDVTDAYTVALRNLTT